MEFIFDLQRFDGEVSIWDGTVGTVHAAVDGVITITTAQQLAALAKAVNNGTNFRGITIKLGADIDLNNIDWTPIGNYDNRFQGTFDGDGHTIRNLKTSINEDYVGLFGYVDGGIVKNVTLINFDVSGDYSYVGGLVGFNDGGTITGNTVVGTANGTTTTFSDVGGLVGRNYGGTVSGNTFCSNKDAVGDSFRTVENNTRLYKITLLEGVTVDGEGLKTIDGVTYAVSGSTVKFTIKRGVTLSEKLDTVTVNGDIDLSGITVTDHWNALNGSDGSEENPYLISTVEGLQYLATYVNVVTNNDEKNCTGVHFKLTNDLDLSSVESWTPIGRSTSVWLDGVSDGAFNGTFDGDGHTISNLTITGTNGNVGLFGCVRYRGVVHDITLTNVNISGSGHVGGIVGENWGTVHNNTISGTIKGDDAVGGIVGFDGKIGYLGGTLHSNTVFSEVSGNTNVGGLAGYNGGDPITGGAIVRDNKYYSNKDAVGLNYEHGISSNNTRYYKLTLPEGVTVTGEPDTLSDGTNIYYTGNVTLNLADNPDDKYIKSTTYNADGTYTYTISDETPITIGNCPKIGNIVFDRSTYQYLINTVEDLQSLAAYVNGGNDCADLTFKLNADIDMSSVGNFTPIGNRNNQFAGTFDGGDFKISNLKINGDNHVGLFGDNKGTVKNVTLDNVYIKGNLNVGGLVGWNSGTVSDSKVTGTVDGHYFIGGFVGQNNGGGPVTGNTFNGIVDGIEIVGGLVGWNKGTVTGGTVNGTVKGSLNVGGLVGSNDGTVSDNIFYSNKNAVGNSGGTVENNTRYYKLTLPDGVTAEGDGVKIVDGVTYATSGSTVTFTIKRGVVLSDKLDPVTVNGDLDLKNGITVTDHWNVLNGGDGSEENPYLIGTVEGLQYLANYVNASDEYYYTNNENQCEGLNFKLAADLDLSSVANWTTIGYRDNPFRGTFDGDGHTISNLTITGKSKYVGLFGNVGKGGTVQNVTLDNVNVSGKDSVGGLIAYNYESRITNCKINTCNINGEYFVGGLIGSNYGEVNDCAVIGGTVNGWGRVGGLIGVGGGTIKNNFVNATVYGESLTGGLVGAAEGTINDNFYYSNVGGIGINYGTESNNTRLYKLTLPDGVVANGDGIKTFYDVLYAAKGSTITFDTLPGVILSGELAPVTVSDADIDLSNAVTVVTKLWGSASGADGSADNPFLIGTVEDLQYLAEYVNGGKDSAGFTFKLAGNIDMSGVEDFTPVGDESNPFNGTFDGGDFKISNLKVSGNDYVGLFGNVGEDGTVQNVALENVDIGGNERVGGVVGYNNGTVTGGTVSGTVSGEYGVGGLIGRNNGTVTEGTFSGKVNGGRYIGGLVGQNNNGGTVTGSFADAIVRSNPRVGGALVGSNSGTVSDNFYHSNRNAIGSGKGTASNNTRLYKLTLPDGVIANGDNVETFDGVAYAPRNSNVTFTVKPGYVLSGKLSPVTVRSADINLSKSVTVTRLWGDGDGSTTNPFLINTAEDLQHLSSYVNDGNDCADLTFKLNANIDMSGVANFAPIGNRNNMFSGTFDGDNKTISNLKISGSNSYVGLFGYNGGTIQNLTLADATVSGASNVGGLVGYNGGTVSGCTVTSTVSGTEYVGGLVGLNSGTLNGNFCHSNKIAVGDESETDITKLYELTLPEGVTADKTKLVVGNKSYVTAGEVTLTAKDTDTGEILGTVSADVAEDVAISADGAEDNPYITITIDDKPTIYGGAGQNIVTGGNALVELDADKKRDGAVINVSGGSTTITGFNNTIGGFTGDTIAVDELNLSETKFTFGGENLTIEGANFRTIVEGVSTTGAGYMTQYLQNATDGTVYKAAIGGESSTLYVAADEDVRANAYIGKNSKVDFANFSGSAVVDLAKVGTDDYWIDSKLGGESAYFDGVNQLVGGADEIIFKGSDANETLTAGSGNTSIYGGGGTNILSGYSGRDKSGSTTFFLLGVNDKAVNTINDFEFVGSDNYGGVKSTADALEIDIENNHFSDVKIDGNDLVIDVTKNDGTATERAVLEGGLGKDFVVNGLVAQVGDTAVNVDDKAQYYLALGANATVNVGGSGDESIWLDDPDSGKEFEGDFTVIDARNSTGKSKLAGNTADNVIYAGSGATSLWGGNGGNDLMYGGAGVDEFYYAAGNGSDTINAGSGDGVQFVDITLDDITIDTVTSSAVAFSFKDGGKLTVNDNNSGVTFTVGNETYRLNGNREFERK
ncbi:MAG: hypothetical protein SR1Q7_00205 [Quinella sp. 1Q7]|nr:hypothetical protein [Quinella sp. 1Q7]